LKFFYFLSDFKITNYFNKIGVAEITAIAGSLAPGDEFAIIGETTGVAKGVIDEVRVDNKVVDKVDSGTVFTMKINQRVRSSDKIYRMVEIEQS